SARGTEEPAGAQSERQRRFVPRAQLDAVSVRLLEVVAENLLELRHAFARLLLEPSRVLLVQLGARLLRQRAVGGVADQDVAEPVRGLVHERARCGLHELTAPELAQHLRGARGRLGAQSEQRAEVEELSLDGAALEQRALAPIEAVEPLREQ